MHKNKLKEKTQKGKKNNNKETIVKQNKKVSTSGFEPRPSSKRNLHFTQWTWLSYACALWGFYHWTIK